MALRLPSARILVIAGGVLLVCFILVGTALLLLRPPDGISEATKNRLQAGMTEQEVEAIIGCPPGNYSTAVPWLMHRDISFGMKLPRGATEKKWTGRDGALVAHFDANGSLLQVQWWHFPED